MKIEKKPAYTKNLKNILRYIASDKISAAIKFEKDLNSKIDALIEFPFMYHTSFYFDENSYRDMQYKGYTVIYKVEENLVSILEIFKWQER